MAVKAKDRSKAGTASAPTDSSRHTGRRAPGRPTVEQASELRENILDAALDVFFRHGFEASSMEGIARAASVAKITLYRHFETKEQLFVEVARRAQLRVRSSLAFMVDTRAPLEQVLRKIIETLYDGFTQPQYLAVMRMVIAEATRFPKLGRAMLNDSKIVAEPLVQYLQQLKDSGQIAIESAYDAATQISGMASGAGRYLLVTPSRHPMSRQHWIETLVSLFTRAWRVEA
ncbi:MAG: hypothetical protein JWR16_2912 [Nevskia sp.]|nr:hypothetical protein [Nevskia sp.]